jgi:hypothetical protein
MRSCRPASIAIAPVLTLALFPSARPFQAVAVPALDFTCGLDRGSQVCLLNGEEPCEVATPQVVGALCISSRGPASRVTQEIISLVLAQHFRVIAREVASARCGNVPATPEIRQRDRRHVAVSLP